MHVLHYAKSFKSLIRFNLLCVDDCGKTVGNAIYITFTASS